MQIEITQYFWYVLSFEQFPLVGCAYDTSMKTGSKSQQSPRDRKEEEAELCSAAVSWQQIAEDLKHWMSVE